MFKNTHLFMKERKGLIYLNQANVLYLFIPNYLDPPQS